MASSKNSEFYHKFEEFHSFKLMNSFLMTQSDTMVQRSAWKFIKIYMKNLKDDSIIRQSPILDYILNIIYLPNSVKIKNTASELLLEILSRWTSLSADIQQKLINYDLMKLLLSLIHVEHQKLLQILKSPHMRPNQFHEQCILISRFIWCLLQLVRTDKDKQYLRNIGGIPLLLLLLNIPITNSTYVEKIELGNGYEKYYEIIDAVTSLISCLCHNEIINLQVAKNSGVYLLAKVLVTLPNISKKTLLQQKLFRALRFLVSLEQNRKKFCHMFPLSNLYDAFVDTGHFTNNLEHYKKVTDIFNSLTKSEMEKICLSVESLNQKEKVKSIRNYEMMDMLGSGAFGSVYKAKLKETDSETFYAIKEVNLSECILGSTTEERYSNIRQMVSELDIIRNKLRHPNVIRYHKIFYEDQNLYVIMAFLEGLSLGEQLNSMKDKDELFDIHRVWYITIQLLSALRYLHKLKAIIHRDLTPNNIIIGARDHATITDFGLAKQRLLESIGQSENKRILGTLNYVSPEVLQHQSYDEKVDTWALGCIVYQMCTLVPPFTGETELHLAEKISKGKYTPLSQFKFVSKSNSDTSNEVDHNLPIELDIFVQHCLEVHPDKRYDTSKLAKLLGEEMLEYVDEIERRCAELEIRMLQRKRLKNQSTPFNNLKLQPCLNERINSGEIVSECYLLNENMIPNQFSSFESTESGPTNSTFTLPENERIKPTFSFSSLDKESPENNSDTSKISTNSPIMRHPKPSSSLISIPSTRLSLLQEDPMEQMLSWLQKLHFLATTSFDLLLESPFNYDESDVIQYKRICCFLYSKLFQLKPAVMKQQLIYMLSGSLLAFDILTDNNGNEEHLSFSNTTMGYEDLYHLIDDLLTKLDYMDNNPPIKS